MDVNAECQGEIALLKGVLYTLLRRLLSAVESAVRGSRHIALPNETWLEVLHFVPFERLHQTVPFACHRFSLLSDSITNKLCPRTILSIKVVWDRKRCRHGTIVANKLPLRSLPIPNTPPPDSIFGIGLVSLEGHLDREMVTFLCRCTQRMDQCRLEFADLANFVRTLQNQKIGLEEFFSAIGRCVKIDVDGRHSFLPACFFDCATVLRCASMHITHPMGGFDVQSLARWLTLCGDQQQVCRKVLSIACPYSQRPGTRSSGLDAQIERLVLATVSLCLKMPKASFSLLLENANLSLDPFDDGAVYLKQLNDSFWELRGGRENGRKSARAKAPPKTTCTIEIGLFSEEEEEHPVEPSKGSAFRVIRQLSRLFDS